MKCSVFAIATMLLIPPSVANVRQQPTGSSDFGYEHSINNPTRLAGTLCYDTYYTPPKAVVCS
jgi:hypothetical protein